MSPPTRAERTLALAQQHVEAAQYMTSEQRFADAHEQWHLALGLLQEVGHTKEQQRAWMRAGLCSQKVAEPDRAASEFTRAIELARAPGLERELAISLGHLGTLLAHRGLSADAAAAWQEAVMVAEGLEEPAIVYTLAGNLGRLELGRGDLDRAESAFRRALSAAERDDNDAERGAWENALAEVLRARGLERDADPHFERAFQAAQNGGDIGLMSLVLANRGNLAKAMGNLETAAHLLQASYNLASVTGDGPAIARAHTNLGNLAMLQNALDDAQRHYTQALGLDKRNGQTHAVIGSLVNLGSLRVTRGDLEGGLKLYREALDKLGPLQSPRMTADVLALIGQVLGRMGDLEAASDHFTRALAAARTSSHSAAEARLAMNLAAIDFAHGEVTRALEGYRGALTLLEAHGEATDLLTGHLVTAECALAAHELDLAERHLEAAYKLLRAHAPESDEGDEHHDHSMREYLDFQAIRTRLAWTRSRSNEDREHFSASIDALRQAGRMADAMGERLALLERLPENEGAKTQAEEGLRWAEKARLETMQLDFGSLLVLLERGEPEALSKLAVRAREKQLHLLALRIERRRVALLISRGERPDAEGLAHTLSAEARTRGALAEVHALEELFA